MDLPDTNPKTRYGAAKPGIHAIPPVALLHLGRGMEDGEVKYGLTNWRENEVSASVYYNAAFRHLASWWDGEEEASDSGVHHLGHVMACCAIILDAQHMGKLNDDRPSVPGPFAEAVKAMTRSLAEETPGGPINWEAPTVAQICEAFGEALDERKAAVAPPASNPDYPDYFETTGEPDRPSLFQQLFNTPYAEVHKHAVEDPDPAASAWEHWSPEDEVSSIMDAAADAIGAPAPGATKPHRLMRLNPSVSLWEVQNLITEFMATGRTDQRLAQLGEAMRHLGHVTSRYTQQQRTALDLYLREWMNCSGRTISMLDDILVGYWSLEETGA